MALTGNQLLVGFSKFINDYWASTSTSAGAAGGTTVIDTALQTFGDDTIREQVIRYTNTGSNQYQNRSVSSYTNSSGTATVAPAFAVQCGSAETYELHKYDPALKFRALDAARVELSDVLFKLVRNDTITADGLTDEWNIPSAVRNGPFAAVIEDRYQNPNADWNVLSNPLGDSLTSWTAAGGIAAATYAQTATDRYIPKYGSSAIKLTYTDGGSDGTYTQVIGDMDSSFTAAGAAGRELVTAWWVYGESTANGAVVEIITDAGTLAASSAHTGTGWELLTATGVVAQTNASTLSNRLRIPTGTASQVVYVEHRYLMYGSAIPNMYHEDNPIKVYRDDTTQKFRLPFVPERGLQIRLIGRDLLSALGDTASTQATNTMEVDAQSAELLYAVAAERLYSGEFLDVQLPDLVAKRIQMIRERVPKLKESVHRPASKARVHGPYF